MQFIPDKDELPVFDVPFFDEARREDGWIGHRSERSYNLILSDITKAIARLDGVLHSVTKGMYQFGELQRYGAQVHYSIEGPQGEMMYGRIDVAALPVKEPRQGAAYEKALRKRHDNSLRHALYNVAQALKVQWNLKQLNPSYVPLMPWLLTKGDMTLSELYRDDGLPMIEAPKPESDGVIQEGQFTEVE